MSSVFTQLHPNILVNDIPWVCNIHKTMLVISFKYNAAKIQINKAPTPLPIPFPPLPIPSSFNIWLVVRRIGKPRQRQPRLQVPSCNIATIASGIRDDDVPCNILDKVPKIIFIISNFFVFTFNQIN
ncbi:hypothetical protein MBGDN05_00745 [Thermoplasmatales archaeon SCGC AB-539-N05]|nr:hypothetical protein MBGDN05_00745 [Thermoplasmatales archaeon SCGC AB-539-N05]